jgi:hypothetical protein
MTLSEWRDLLLFMAVLCAPRLLAGLLVPLMSRVAARYDADTTTERKEQEPPC